MTAHINPQLSTQMTDNQLHSQLEPYYSRKKCFYQIKQKL